MKAQAEQETTPLAEELLVGGVLAGACCGDRLPHELRGLEPEHFVDMTLSQIWLAICSCIEANVPPDLVTVTRRLRDWDEPEAMLAAAELCDGGIGTNVVHWARLVESDGRKREFARDLASATERAAAGGSPDDIAAGVQDALRKAQQRVSVGGLEPAKSLIGKAMLEIERRAVDPEGGRLIKTGLHDLDAMLELGTQQLTVLAARPGMGKSALAGNIATHVATEADKPGVAIFSLEMSATALILRMMAHRVGKDERDFPELIKSGSGHRVAEAANYASCLNLHIDDRAGMSVDEMSRSLTKIGKPRLVIVDYLQLSRLDQNLERQDLRIGAVTKALKNLSKVFDCHVLALSQLNRKLEDRNNKRPTLGDLRDSGNIEEDADNVLFIYRPGKYEDVADTTAEIIIAKQRAGETGSVAVAWRGETKTFSNLTHRAEDR